MVIKLQLHKISILLGIIICLLSMLYVQPYCAREVLRREPTSLRTLIIDAGHGGADGGAVGIDGTPESPINWQIAIKLQSLSKLCGIPIVMTRNSETIDYPSDATTISEKKISDQQARLRLIRDYPNGILYSIHQNAYPNKSISGLHVLYGHNESSRNLGNLLQSQFNEFLSDKSRRVAAEISDDIYLMRNCECTAVLIECGFISNSTDCKLLQTDTHQKKLAVIMLGGYLQFLN